MSDVQRLIIMLQSKNSNERYDACEELRVSSLLPPEALEALRSVTNDTNPDVADAARRAIELHSPTSFPIEEINTETGLLKQRRYLLLGYVLLLAGILGPLYLINQALPLGYFHVFFSTGGFWLLGIILTGLYCARLLDVLRQVSLGICLGLVVFAFFSNSLFEFDFFVTDGYKINPGLFSILGGIVGGTYSKLIISKRGKENGKEVSEIIIGVIIGSTIGIFLILPALIF